MDELEISQKDPLKWGWISTALQILNSNVQKLQLLEVLNISLGIERILGNIWRTQNTPAKGPMGYKGGEILQEYSPLEDLSGTGPMTLLSTYGWISLTRKAGKPRKANRKWSSHNIPETVQRKVGSSCYLLVLQWIISMPGRLLMISPSAICCHPQKLPTSPFWATALTLRTFSWTVGSESIRSSAEWLAFCPHFVCQQIHKWLCSCQLETCLNHAGLTKKAFPVVGVSWKRYKAPLRFYFTSLSRPHLELHSSILKMTWQYLLTSPFFPPIKEGRTQHDGVYEKQVKKSKWEGAITLPKV